MIADVAGVGRTATDHYVLLDTGLISPGDVVVGATGTLVREASVSQEVLELAALDHHAATRSDVVPLLRALIVSEGGRAPDPEESVRLVVRVIANAGCAGALDVDDAARLLWRISALDPALRGPLAPFGGFSDGGGSQDRTLRAAEIRRELHRLL